MPTKLKSMNRPIFVYANADSPLCATSQSIVRVRYRLMLCGTLAMVAQSSKSTNSMCCPKRSVHCWSFNRNRFHSSRAATTSSRTAVGNSESSLMASNANKTHHEIDVVAFSIQAVYCISCARPSQIGSKHFSANSFSQFENNCSHS